VHTFAVLDAAKAAATAADGGGGGVAAAAAAAAAAVAEVRLPSRWLPGFWALLFLGVVAVLHLLLILLQVCRLVYSLYTCTRITYVRVISYTTMVAGGWPAFGRCYFCGWWRCCTWCLYSCRYVYIFSTYTNTV
jgi:hypothetical protein